MTDPSTPSGGDPAGAPLFSVLIATYNQEQYLRETLDSVAAQTFDDYEVVIVNDGSTDGTQREIERWRSDFGRTRANRVVVETTPNSGQSAAFEHGFSRCSGRYVCLLDSDDRWLSDKLAAVREAVEADPGAGMVAHPLFVIDAQGRRTGDVRPMRAKLSDGDIREQVRQTGRQVAPATSGVVIRADVFRQLVPMPTRSFRSAADAYLTLGASLLAPVRALEQTLAEYRMHPQGNYLRRMASAEGLRESVGIQSAIARHFGLERAAQRNSYFQRNAFALAKYEAGVAGQVRAYVRLVRATSGDTSFGARSRLVLTAYWTLCLLAPRPVFARLWQLFQRKQTGMDRLAREVS